MAALDLSASTVPGVARKNTFGAATIVRRVTVPTELRGERGGGLDVCVYPVGTAAYWVSPDATQPADGATYDPAAETTHAILPADQWSTIPWSRADGDPPSVALVSADAAQVVYVAVYPARVPA